LGISPQWFEQCRLSFARSVEQIFIVGIGPAQAFQYEPTVIAQSCTVLCCTFGIESYLHKFFISSVFIGKGKSFVRVDA
jgi:hypothetical protein